MRRLVEPEVAAVIHRGQTLVSGLGIVDAVIAASARHQWRNHHLRSHRQRLLHKIRLELVADFDEHSAELMTESERPGKLLRPVTLEDVQIGAANRRLDGPNDRVFRCRNRRLRFVMERFLAVSEIHERLHPIIVAASHAAAVSWVSGIPLISAGRLA